MLRPAGWAVVPALTEQPNLWRGCKVFAALQEGNGNKFWDYAGKTYIEHTADDDVDFPWIPTAYGPGLDIGDTGIAAQSEAQRTISGGTAIPLTVAVGIVRLTSGTLGAGSTGVATMACGVKTENEFRLYGVGCRFVDASAATIAGSAGSATWGGADPVLGDLTVLVLRSPTSSDHTLFYPGGRATNTTNIGSLSGAPEFVLGGENNRLADFAIMFGGYWDRALSDAEAEQLIRDPWGMIRMRDEAGVVYSIAAAAGGGLPAGSLASMGVGI